MDDSAPNPVGSTDATELARASTAASTKSQDSFRPPDGTAPQSTKTSTPKPQAPGGHFSRVMRQTLLTLKISVAFALGLTACTYWFGRDPSGTALRAYHWPANLAQASYLAVRMLFASPDSHEVADMPWLRLLAPFVLLSVGAATVVRSIRIRLKLSWSDWNPRRGQRKRVVVIGLGRKGLETLMGEIGDTTVDVVALEMNPRNAHIEQAESVGATVWVGDALSVTDLMIALGRRPCRLWVMTGDSGLNVDITRKIRALIAPDEPGSTLPINDVTTSLTETWAILLVTRKWLTRVINNLYQSVTCRVNLLWRRVYPKWQTDVYVMVSDFVQRRHAGALRALNQDTAQFETHLHNHEECLAATIVRDHPFRPTGSNTPSALILGAGPLGRALARELLLLCHFPECEPETPDDDPHRRTLPLPRITLVDERAAARAELDAELPFLSSAIVHPHHATLSFADVEFVHEDAQTWRFEQYERLALARGPFTHILLMMGSTLLNTAISDSIWAWHQLLPMPMPTIVPVVYDQSADANVAHSAVNAAPFFARDAIRRYRTWEEDEIFPIARWINWVYMREMGAMGAAFNDRRAQAQAKREWTTLIEHNRRSSAVLARYWRNRWGNPDDGSLILPALVSESDLMQEARCEHRRWIAFQLVENLSPFNRSENESRLDEKIARGQGSLKLRELARVHKDLKPFKDLDDVKTQKKDVVIVASMLDIVRMVKGA